MMIQRTQKLEQTSSKDADLKIVAKKILDSDMRLVSYVVATVQIKH